MSVVQLSLSADEALVLFEWLSARENASDPEAKLTPEDIALGRVLGELERQLAEPFAANYAALVNAARERLTTGS